MQAKSYWRRRSTIVLIAWPLILMGLLAMPAPHAGAQIAPSPLRQDGHTATPLPPGASATAPEEFAGLPAGFTADGRPYLGDADAPLTMIEYSDFLCPFCGRHFAETLPTLLERYGKSGEVRFVFHDFPIASLHPNAPAGHAAAICAAEQGAVHFWQMHEALFRNQQAWSDEAELTPYFRGLAGDIGLEPRAFATCLRRGQTAALVAERLAQGEEKGFNATPSFELVLESTGAAHELVGAYPVEEFTLWIDTLLATGAPPETPESAQPELPLWATPAGLAPDPARPGYTIAGDAYKGNPDAPLVVVEFSDFQCPACGEHALAVQPAIDEALIAQGDVRWVFKHLPLQMHPRAPVAAVAAECAGRAGLFWEMHDRLFATQAEWTSAETDAPFIALARELELDGEEFAACLNSRQALEVVLHDLYDAQDVVRTTPSFILLDGEAGAIYQGTQDPEAFVTILEEFLVNLTGEPSPAATAAP